MEEKIVKGPGGWYIKTADDKDIRLNEQLLDAFKGNSLKKAIEFMSDNNTRGTERLHLKKGGETKPKCKRK